MLLFVLLLGNDNPTTTNARKASNYHVYCKVSTYLVLKRLKLQQSCLSSYVSLLMCICSLLHTVVMSSSSILMCPWKISIVMISRQQIRPKYYGMMCVWYTSGGDPRSYEATKAVAKKGHFSCNVMQWSGKRNDFLTMWQETVLRRFSVSVMLERFGREYKYIRVWQEYIIHHGSSFQQVKNTIFGISFSTLGRVVLQFCELQIAINGLGARICHRKSVLNEELGRKAQEK